MSSILTSDEITDNSDEQYLEVCFIPWVIGLLTRTDDQVLRAVAQHFWVPAFSGGLDSCLAACPVWVTNSYSRI